MLNTGTYKRNLQEPHGQSTKRHMKNTLKTRKRKDTPKNTSLLKPLIVRPVPTKNMSKLALTLKPDF